MIRLTDVIKPDEAGSLPGLFETRVRRSPNAIACKTFQHNRWVDLSWQDMANQIETVRTALLAEGLQRGDRIAIMMNNRPEWVIFEQAALGAGLIVVPVYPNDRPANIGFILDDADIKLFVVEKPNHCEALLDIKPQLQKLLKIILIEKSCELFTNLQQYSSWLQKTSVQTPSVNPDGDNVATIVYTSGTTGRPKGVMLSHNNILHNAYGCSQCTEFYPDDVFLSFLPLSHMFERTAGYYLPVMAGCTIAYARSIEQLGDDLQQINPTILVTVPRIFERVYNRITTQLAGKSAIARFLFRQTIACGWHFFRYQQNKAGWHPRLVLHPFLQKVVADRILMKLGKNLRLAISGGAPLSHEVGKTFIALGLTISQGYGMTELSPVVSTNLLHDNEPDSVGQPLFNLEVKLADNDELCVRGPNVMLGYLNNEKATRECIDDEGWLHTGDKAKIINNHIYITGRIKEILVLSNGEKIPPADIEMALCSDPLLEQVMVLGEGKPYLAALCVLNNQQWQKIAEQYKLDNANSPAAKKHILQRIQRHLKDFPGYANIYSVHATHEPWTVENGLITPTLKLKRKYIYEKFQSEIDNMYKGH